MLSPVIDTTHNEACCCCNAAWRNPDQNVGNICGSVVALCCPSISDDPRSPVGVCRAVRGSRLVGIAGWTTFARSRPNSSPLARTSWRFHRAKKGVLFSGPLTQVSAGKAEPLVLPGCPMGFPWSCRIGRPDREASGEAAATFWMTNPPSDGHCLTASDGAYGVREFADASSSDFAPISWTAAPRSAPCWQLVSRRGRALAVP